MSILLILLCLADISFVKSNNRVLKQSYERITYQEATGDYADSHYLSSHSIERSRFTFESSGDRSDHSVELAFQNDNNYWSSKDPNTDDFKSSIIITFNDPTVIEAFILSALYDDNGLNRRTYNGFPTKIKVYTSNNDEPLSLNTIFVGTPVYPMTTAQFVFKNPVECKQLKLEFIDVTEDYKNANGDKSTCIKYLNLIKTLSYSDIKYVLPNGNYDNSIYTDFHRIPDNQFNYTSSGDRDGNSIDYAFDDDSRAFWVANIESDGTKGSHIIINFKKQTLFEGFFIQGYEYTSNRKTTYPGFPLKVNFYYSNYDEEFKLHTKFSGQPSDKKEIYQYILSNKVLCDRIKIEFIEVIEDTRISNTFSAAINKITLFQSFENEGLPFQGVTGAYADSNYLSTHMISSNDFELTSLGGDKEGHPIYDAKDDDVKTYWVSNTVNSDTYHNEVIVKFNDPVLLEAVLLDPVLQSKNKVVTFSGFPIRFKIYAALNDNDEFELKASYVEMPDNSMNRIQFVLPETINCTKLKLEFVEVTPFVFGVSTSDLNAAASKFMFIKKASYDVLSYHENEGYTNSHLIPTSKFTYSCTGYQDEYPISNAFDDKTDTFWSSNFENNDPNFASIFINFTQPLKLEGFLLGIFYNRIAATNHYAGYPKKLNVYTSNNDEPFVKKATFVGNPKDIEFYQFEFREPIICSKLQLEFVEVTTNTFYKLNKPYPSLSYVKLLGEIIDFSSNNFQDDFTTQYVNNSFPLNGINDTDLVINDLPNDNDYLFVVEKQFFFRNVSFSCPDASMSAIKSNHSNHVTVERCQFNNCSVKNKIGNGGAILSLNCVLKCSNSDFSNCKSKINGGGGGIFIHLKENINEDLIIDHCNFNHCSATFGGALYLYSNVITNKIVVKNCIFEYNSLIESKDSLLNGGSAFYIHAVCASTLKCKFFQNSGDCSMKIDNDFDRTAFELDRKSNSGLLIKDCEFEIDSKSKSSLSYVRGHGKGVLIDVKKCFFIGEPLENIHHINVESKLNKNEEKPKLRIKSCIFSSDKKKSINLNFDEMSNSLIEFNTKKQVFNYNKNDVKSEKSNSNKLLVTSVSLICSGAIVLTAVVLIVIVKKRTTVDETSNTNVDNDL